VQSANDVIVVAFHPQKFLQQTQQLLFFESNRKSKEKADKSYCSISLSLSLRREKSDLCKSGLCKVLH
jgi:hypothetical protein